MHVKNLPGLEEDVIRKHARRGMTKVVRDALLNLFVITGLWDSKYTMDNCECENVCPMVDMNLALTNLAGREIIYSDKDLHPVNSPAPLLKSPETNSFNTFAPPTFLPA